MLCGGSAVSVRAWTITIISGLFVRKTPLPHHWMRHAKIGAHENDNVRHFKNLRKCRERIETKTLLICDMAGCHALARVGIAVQTTHAKLK